MSYKKPRWRGHAVEINDFVLEHDWDLVPGIILCHDAAVDFWEEWWRDWHAMEPANRPSAEPPLYFDAVRAAGLGPLSKRIGEIQAARSKLRASSEEVKAHAVQNIC